MLLINILQQVPARNVCISIRCSCITPEQLSGKCYHLMSASRTFYIQLEVADHSGKFQTISGEAREA
jgi:hypothetical protein